MPFTLHFFVSLLSSLLSSSVLCALSLFYRHFPFDKYFSPLKNSFLHMFLLPPNNSDTYNSSNIYIYAHFCENVFCTYFSTKPKIPLAIVQILSRFRCCAHLLSTFSRISLSAPSRFSEYVEFPNHGTRVIDCSHYIYSLIEAWSEYFTRGRVRWAM